MMLAAQRFIFTGSGIRGFAYPLETLTAPSAGQWAIDGVPVIGQTGSTFQIPLLAYGRTITCANFTPVIVWSPLDVVGVISAHIADRQVLNTVSPNVSAVDGSRVARWNSISGLQQMNQTTLTSQPIYRATGQNGNPSVQFDGVNNNLGGTISVNGASILYTITGFSDTNPTGGNSTHVPLAFRNNFNGVLVRIFSRNTSNNISAELWRRGGFPTAQIQISASNSNYNVITTETNTTTNTASARLNGALAGSQTLNGSGTIQSLNNNNAFFGVYDANQTFPGNLCCVIIATQQLSVSDRSRLERFAGLFGNLNIPLS
jgi:hypothetical protein